MGQELFVRDSRIICGGQSFYGTDIGGISTNELYLENNNNRLRWGRGGQLYESVDSFDVGSTSEPNNSMWTSVESGIRRLYVARGGRKISMSHLQSQDSHSEAGSGFYFVSGTYTDYWNPPYPSGFSRFIITDVSIEVCPEFSFINTNSGIYVANDNSSSNKRVISTTTTTCAPVSSSSGLTVGTPLGYVNAGERIKFNFSASAGFFRTFTVNFNFYVAGWYAPSNHYVNAPVFQ